MKTTVGYYLKGQPKQYRTFDTLPQAQAFMAALNQNPDCESYGIERNQP